MPTSWGNETPTPTHFHISPFVELPDHTPLSVPSKHKPLPFPTDFFLLR